MNLAQRAAARASRQASLDSPAPGSELTLKDVLADALPGPEALAEQAERRDRVWQALGQLAPTRRAAVVQRYYLGLSEPEIAANQDVAPGTVKWRRLTMDDQFKNTDAALHSTGGYGVVGHSDILGVSLPPGESTNVAIFDSPADAGHATSLRLHLSLTAAEYAPPSAATPVVEGNTAQAQPAILLAMAGPFEFDFVVPVVQAK